MIDETTLKIDYEKLEKYKHQTKAAISEQYNLTYKASKMGVELRKYKEPISYTPPGWTRTQTKRSTKGTITNKISENNLIRSRQNLIDLTLANEEIWRSFITLTFDPSRHKDCDKVQYANKILHKYKTQVMRKYPGFKFIGTIEAQKNGNWHYHFLTNLEVKSELIPQQPGTTDRYDVKYWTSGYSSAFDLKLTDEYFNVALYLIKYLYKGIDHRLFMKKKVYHSMGLKRLKTIKYLISDEKYQKLVQEIKEKDTTCKIKELTPKSRYSVATTIISTTEHLDISKL